MAENGFKEKLSAMIKKHNMKAKTVTGAINAISPKLDMERDAKQGTILKIVALAGEKGASYTDIMTHCRKKGRKG